MYEKRYIYILDILQDGLNHSSNHVKTNNVFSLFLNFLIALLLLEDKSGVVEKKLHQSDKTEHICSDIFFKIFSISFSLFVLRSIKYSLQQTSRRFFYGFGYFSYFSVKHIMMEFE